MKLVWSQVFATSGEDAFSCSVSEDLSSFSYWQRSTIREHLMFAARTSASRCPNGQRITISLKEVPFNCHVYKKVDGLCALVVSDAEYADRVAHTLISKILMEFEKKFGVKWKTVATDVTFEFPELAELMRVFQNPSEADKLTKVHESLEEIKGIMHKNIEEVLKRGEKLDDLLMKSDDIGELSKMFHTKAKKNNQCCQWY